LNAGTRWDVVADTFINEHIVLLAFCFDHIAELSIKPTPAFIEEVVQLLQEVVSLGDVSGTLGVVEKVVALEDHFKVSISMSQC
jgi:hypothetical protein